MPAASTVTCGVGGPEAQRTPAQLRGGHPVELAGDFRDRRDMDGVLGGAGIVDGAREVDDDRLGHPDGRAVGRHEPRRLERRRIRLRGTSTQHQRTAHHRSRSGRLHSAEKSSPRPVSHLTIGVTLVRPVRNLGGAPTTTSAGGDGTRVRVASVTAPRRPRPPPPDRSPAAPDRRPPAPEPEAFLTLRQRVSSCPPSLVARSVIGAAPAAAEIASNSSKRSVAGGNWPSRSSMNRVSTRSRSAR